MPGERIRLLFGSSCSLPLLRVNSEDSIFFWASAVQLTCEMDKQAIRMSIQKTYNFGRPGNGQQNRGSKTGLSVKTPRELVVSESIHRIGKGYPSNSGSSALLLSVVEDDAQGLTVSRPNAADAVAESDAIHATGTPYGAMMNRKHNAVPLTKRYDYRP